MRGCEDGAEMAGQRGEQAFPRWTAATRASRQDAAESAEKELKSSCSCSCLVSFFYHLYRCVVVNLPINLCVILLVLDRGQLRIQVNLFPFTLRNSVFFLRLLVFRRLELH